MFLSAVIRVGEQWSPELTIPKWMLTRRASLLNPLTNRSNKILLFVWKLHENAKLMWSWIWCSLTIVELLQCSEPIRSMARFVDTSQRVMLCCPLIGDPKNTIASALFLRQNFSWLLKALGLFDFFFRFNQVGCHDGSVHLLILRSYRTWGDSRSITVNKKKCLRNRSWLTSDW